MFDRRVGFIGSVSGERFALPGPAREDNRWTVDVHVFQAENVVGRRMLQLERSNVATSGLQLARGPDGEVILSAPVQGFMSPDDQLRVHGWLEVLADVDGLIRVVFGEVPLTEPYENKPCITLSDVSTPRSDKPCTSLSDVSSPRSDCD